MNDLYDIFGDDGFNAEEVPDHEGFELLPPDWYEVMITEAKVEDNNAKNGKRLSFELTVTQEKFNGRKVWGGFNIDHPSAKAVEISLRELAQLAIVCGVPRLKDSSELLDKVFLAKIEVEPASNGYKEKNVYKNAKALGSKTSSSPSSGASTQKAKPVTKKTTPVQEETEPEAKPSGKFPWEM